MGNLGRASLFLGSGKSLPLAALIVGWEGVESSFSKALVPPSVPFLFPQAVFRAWLDSVFSTGFWLLLTLSVLSSCVGMSLEYSDGCAQRC